MKSGGVQAERVGASSTFSSVLVANRGEIARRIFHSCRALGLATVAVYADPDAGSPHVTEADCAVRVPGAAAAETYLRAELIVAAARQAGAEAVHPGYGFLAENAEFARAVQAAGLVWIGPPARAVELMGSKIEAKRLMAAAGVPVLARLDPAAVDERDLPVIVKASAGGGGRGMRIVHTLAELGTQLASARGEAERSFGDPEVFCERYLATGRHLEVQLLADQHGTIWQLGERECSVQRRHQKIIEESPSPLAERLPGLRERLGEAAVLAARAVGYTGAGTVEFVVDGDGRFYFLEMNTRLQVEHPVTEARTGLDLVRLQLELAAGARLPVDPPVAGGHAIEVRLYAEDPARDWQPQAGTLHRFDVPGVTAWFEPVADGLRLDSAVRDGYRVSPHYDPMLAKLVCAGADRQQVARRLAAALAGATIHGLATNRDLLVRVLRHQTFLRGEADTSFLPASAGPLTAPLADEHAERLSALAAALADSAVHRDRLPVPAGVPSGWRNVVSQPQRVGYRGRHGLHRLGYRWLGSAVSVEAIAAGPVELGVLSCTPEEVVLEVEGLRRTFRVARYPGLVCVDSALGPVSLAPVERFPDQAEHPVAGSLLAPLPGSVVRLGAAVGEQVGAGQPLLWIEAMKMEHPIVAPAAGVVTRLPVSVGSQVGTGDVLVVLGPPSGAQ
jgi:acetyl/propionyl-CoA carboxylase alpha subunit